MPARASGAIVLLAAIVSACIGTTAPTESASDPNPTAGHPAVSPPTTFAPSTEPTALPIPSVAPEGAEILIWVIYGSDTGSGGDPGTTVLADGRIIWSKRSDQVVEGRLTAEALSRLRDQIGAIHALDANGQFLPELRPGAQPPGHGASFYVFHVIRDGRPVVVDSSDPRSFAGEERFWIIPPEMAVLAALADRLDHPLADLGSDAFEGGVRPYRPNRYLVQIYFSDQRGDGMYRADEVRWPFGQPIERAGEPVDIDDENWTARCLLIDSKTATEMAAAEALIVAARDLAQPRTEVEYDSSAGGSILVRVTQVLPQESNSCVELFNSR